MERFGLTSADVERFVWTIEPDGRRLGGHLAAANVLRVMGGGWRALGWAATLPGAGLVYGLVARLRPRLSAMWGDPPPYP